MLLEIYFSKALAKPIFIESGGIKNQVVFWYHGGIKNVYGDQRPFEH